MRMVLDKPTSPERRRITQALLAIESQKGRQEIEETETQRQQRQRMQNMLDHLSEPIFERIRQLSDNNKSRLALNTIPGFGAECDRIYGHGFGIYDPLHLDAWLQRLDLKHVFRASDHDLEW